MMPIAEFAALYKPDEEPDWFELYKQQYHVPAQITHPDMLTAMQSKMMRDLKIEYNNDFRKNWKRHIGSFLKFKQP